MSQEQIEASEKLAEIKLPFGPRTNLIFYFKSISHKELEEQPVVMTLLRNCAQSNMAGCNTWRTRRSAPAANA